MELLFWGSAILWLWIVYDSLAGSFAPLFLLWSSSIGWGNGLFFRGLEFWRGNGLARISGADWARSFYGGQPAGRLERDNPSWLEGRDSGPRVVVPGSFWGANLFDECGGRF